MADVVNSETRSRMMAGIGSRNTKPERLVKGTLHALGFRFGHNPELLPGRPDVVLPRWRVAVFVHGCFWHMHGCSLSKMPKSNTAFWKAKLMGNRARDKRVQQALMDEGWRVLTVWECALRGSTKEMISESLMVEAAAWIRDREALSQVFVVGETRLREPA